VGLAFTVVGGVRGYGHGLWLGLLVGSRFWVWGAVGSRAGVGFRVGAESLG
jgi:hypothetical protein